MLDLDGGIGSDTGSGSGSGFTGTHTGAGDGGTKGRPPVELGLLLALVVILAAALIGWRAVRNRLSAGGAKRD